MFRKQVVLLLGFFLVISGTCLAQQWATSGNNIFNTNSGNVGIGTTNPTTSLHIQGGANSTGLRLDFSPANSGRVYDLLPNRPGLTNAGFSIRDVTAGVNLLTFDENGFMGINTSAPAMRLHLQGADNNTGLRLDYSGANAGRIYDLLPNRPGFTNAGFSIRDVTAGVNRIVIDGTGNVGIATSTPSFVLDVDGQIHSSSGIVFPDGSTQTTATLQDPQGPTGPQGPQGPPGPPAHTSAVCSANIPSCPDGFVIQPTLAPCTVTSDTGSCSSTGSGRCVVCKP